MQSLEDYEKAEEEKAFMRAFFASLFMENLQLSCGIYLDCQPGDHGPGRRPCQGLPLVFREIERMAEWW